MYLRKNTVNLSKIKYNLYYMDTIYDTDQYGNRLGTATAATTNVLSSSVGLGADQITLYNSWVRSAYGDGVTADADGVVASTDTLLMGDWAGSKGATGNAMDDLLSSEKFNNGRVPDVRMNANVNKSSTGEIVIVNDNQQTGVKGIVEQTVISDLFLSEMNTKAIQDTIRYGVYNATNMIVDYQSPTELYIIMRSIMLQHANFKVGQTDLLDGIKKLNKLVVDYAVKEVSSNVQQYDMYIQDIQSLPTPMDRPDFSGDTSRNRSQDMSAHIGI
jgi:hypothetical protein